jgi:hypothetical protein
LDITASDAERFTVAARTKAADIPWLVDLAQKRSL